MTLPTTVLASEALACVLAAEALALAPCADARDANIAHAIIAITTARRRTREGRPLRATAPTIGTRASRAMLTS